MRIMTKRQEEFLNELLKLANGDSLLIEEALRVAGAAPDASYQKVVEYITARVKK